MDVHFSRIFRKFLELTMKLFATFFFFGKFPEVVMSVNTWNIKVMLMKIANSKATLTSW